MSDEKTEEPTEHKLRTAREEGQMAKSTDVAVATVTLAVVGALLAMGQGILERLRIIISLALDFGTEGSGEDLLYKRMAAMGMEAMMAVGPLVLVAAIAAAIGMAMQVGIQISTKAVEPKFDAINPAEGIKKVFSVKSVITFFQLLLKAIVIGSVMWNSVVQLMPLISSSVYQSPEAIGAIAWSAVSKILLSAMLLFIVMAPLDYAMQHHFFMKGQRMSKDEIKREHKGQEGDPEVKGQRKQIAYEWANEEPGQNVGRADAVIVNPTHYAVAIRYRADEAGVPVVLAKGVDEAALRIRGYATTLGVPVFAHPPLARALHKLDVHEPVPEELFEAVAAVLRWVDEIGGQRARNGTDLPQN